MKNDFEEKMADIMIGEAVTALLDEDVAISWAVLTERLRAAIEHETDEDRVRAGLHAIEEVRREMQIRTGEKTGVTGADGLSAQKLH
jgi:probable RcsB/C two-component-system connector